MGRMRKRIDDETKTSLPPCRVCGAPGSGFHYGANTCEACKGFFHRSLKMWTQYSCNGKGECVMEHGHRILCQLCRYQKCLSVGMAKEAIKTGRYSCTKRTKDILEVKKLKEKVTTKDRTTDNQIQTRQSQSGNIGDNRCESFVNTDSQSGKCSLPCTTTSDQFSLGCASNFSQELPDTFNYNKDLNRLASSNLRSNVNQCDFVQAETESRISFMHTESENQAGYMFPEQVGTVLISRKSGDDGTSLNEMESFFSDCNQDVHLLPSYHSQLQKFISPSSSLTPSSIASPAYSSSLEGSSAESSPLMLQSTSSISKSSIFSLGALPPSSTEIYRPVTSSWGSVTSPQTSVVSHTCRCLSPTSSATFTTSPLSLQQIDMEACTSNTPNTTCVRSGYDMTTNVYVYDVDLRIISELYNDKEGIVRTLMEADEACLVPMYGRMTNEEIKQKQLEHIESCRLKTEIFGTLRKVPDYEYDYIFVTTGLDTDDRQEKLNVLGVNMEKMIRAMVKFCKSIPGFSKLTIADKIKLIKYSRQEFYMFLIYNCIDVENRIFRGLDNQWKCTDEIYKMISDPESEETTETLDVYFRFCQSIQKLKLSDEELVVIRALIVMSPDRDIPVVSPVAREIQWHLNLCLIHVLSKRYPNPLFIYAKIIDRLTQARSQTESLIYHLRKFNIDKYSNLVHNPLLREMCGGIFFDCDDNDDDDLFADT